MTRLDRYGDPIEDDGAGVGPAPPAPPAAAHDPECRDGWLGEDLEGRPVPCLECRPHLRWGRS